MGGGFPGDEILGAGEPRAVLARLVDGDPLEIGPRCRDVIERDAWFVAFDRLWLRAVARIAYSAPRYRGRLPLDEWLLERIGASVSELIREDREEERRAIPPSEPWDPRYAFVSEVLGIHPASARRACNAFNDLPREVRQAYFAVYVKGKSVRRFVAEGHGPPNKVKADLERALRALSPPYGREEGLFGKGDRDA